jgi:hypothetical protein
LLAFFHPPFCSVILRMLFVVTLECSASNGWIIHGT